MKTSIPFLGVLALTACQVQGPESTQHSDQAAVAACVRPRDDLEIRSSTTLCPGAYTLSDAAGDGLLKVTRSGVKLTATGVTIRGSGSGFGVLARGVDRLTITASGSARGVLSGFTSAVLIEGGKSHSVSNLDLSDNAQRPLTDSDGDFLAVWPDFPEQLALQQIGNAIVLVGVDGATIKDNVGKRQQNGLGLFASRNVTAKGNDFSDNRGWGIHLHGSSSNTITDNRADDCNLAASSYCHDVQQDGCDSAGILVIKGANDNLVQKNSFRNGGDGIFSAAQQDDFRWGADRNRYLDNDVTGAKHLGIEATFAEGLVIEGNKVHDAGRSGIWLGFSHHSVVRKNSILRSGWSGIENESAHDLEISQNDIKDSQQHGIRLRQAAPNVQESARYRIVDNVIASNGGAGIAAEDTHELTVERNRLEHNRETNLRLSLAYRTAIGTGVVRSNVFRTALGSCGNVLASCSCRAHDGDLAGCDAAEGCAYYSCSEQCHPRDTSLCDGGCASECTGSCRDHDGTATACDAAGCAYYFCSGQCHERGTSCDQAGCSADCGSATPDCRAHDGDLPACDDAGCAFYACSDECHPRGSSCTEGGCTESCDPLPAQTFVSKAAGAGGCPWGGWIGNNDWGSSDPTFVAASLCGL